MVTYLILLFILSSTEIPRTWRPWIKIESPPSIHETRRPVIKIESQKITLYKRPRLGETVRVVYEIIPKNSKKNLKIVFHDFKGIRLVSKDTIYHFNAVKGIPRKFSIDVEYISTPAILCARVEGTYSRISLARYLLKSETGEYGTMKEIQFNPPVEYRFNTGHRKFEQEVFSFEKERWHRNREIIDTVRIYAPDISDSLALLLYSDLPHVSYPSGITNWWDKAKYLLKHGWQTYKDESERKKFLQQLTTETEEERMKSEREKQRARQIKKLKWTLGWLIPVILLTAVLILLLIIRSKKPSKAITSKYFDIVTVFLVSIFTIGFVLYFAWPRLTVLEELARKGQREYERVMKEHKKQAQFVYDETERLNLLADLSNFELVSKGYLPTSKGIGATFEYKDTNHSNIGVEYHFSAQVISTATGFEAKLPGYPPLAAIEKFEGNKRAHSFLVKNKVKRVHLRFRDSHFTITINDTVIRNGDKIPILLEYDGKTNSVSNYIVQSDFDDESYPEIRRLKDLCEKAGYPVRKDKYISRHKGLATLVEGGGNDTLRVWFFSEKPDDFTYQWIPVPKFVKVPQSIIDQLYLEFSKVGLPLEYARNYLKILSASGLRQPNYFTGNGDRVQLEATIKWVTGVDWLDEINNGEGAQFQVLYEYFADSLRLGKCIGITRRRGTPVRKDFYLRPIRKIIPKNEARDKLFKFLPEEEKFYHISVGLNISKELSDYGDFIYLIGRYNWYTGIKVDLETGAVIETPSIYY